MRVFIATTVFSLGMTASLSVAHEQPPAPYKDVAAHAGVVPRAELVVLADERRWRPRVELSDAPDGSRKPPVRMASDESSPDDEDAQPASSDATPARSDPEREGAGDLSVSELC